MTVHAEGWMERLVLDLDLERCLPSSLFSYPCQAFRVTYCIKGEGMRLRG